MTELKPPSPAMLDRYQGDDVKPLYTGRVRVSGGQAQHGRASGVVRSDDGALAVDLRLPPELGGPGGGANPEQLLAASYAGCFHGIEVAVTFARDPADGLYLLSAEIVVHLPGMDENLACELVRNTERVCPYAKMFHRGVSHVVHVRVGPQAPPL
ncbi:peroxiredoxin [Stenotrophomonas maltophilia]|uniref:peroxiredoxin n=1 Tax=Stenotrophomonas geniculata TaxID=86188 RepID=UPI001F532E80|nr:peroxiredoxin [Stenotrophomonas geniculata]MCI1065586.1 peroxiredoxin [Stenotrophomonas maltophilia]MCI1106706.1 peroxiredoxin [Stenotrophomonas maltophilia]